MYVRQVAEEASFRSKKEVCRGNSRQQKTTDFSSVFQGFFFVEKKKKKKALKNIPRSEEGSRRRLENTETATGEILNVWFVESYKTVV